MLIESTRYNRGQRFTQRYYRQRLTEETAVLMTEFESWCASLGGNLKTF